MAFSEISPHYSRRYNITYYKAKDPNSIQTDKVEENRDPQTHAHAYTNGDARHSYPWCVLHSIHYLFPPFHVTDHWSSTHFTVVKTEKSHSQRCIGFQNMCFMPMKLTVLWVIPHSTVQFCRKILVFVERAERVAKCNRTPHNYFYGHRHRMLSPLWGLPLSSSGRLTLFLEFSNILDGDSKQKWSLVVIIKSKRLHDYNY